MHTKDINTQKKNYLNTFQKNNMALILTRKPELVDVPEEDIQEAIVAIQGFLDKNPGKSDCGVAIFGHRCFKVHAATLENDVREAAKTATEYTKIH